jgi:hypothetical protein
VYEAVTTPGIAADGSLFSSDGVYAATAASLADLVCCSEMAKPSTTAANSATTPTAMIVLHGMDRWVTAVDRVLRVRLLVFPLAMNNPGY